MSPSDAQMDYVERNIPYRAIGYSMVIFFVTTITGMGIVWGVYGFGIQKINPKNVLERPMNLPPLMVNYRQEYEAVKEQAMKSISEYGWVDQGTGKVRIPIERAMDIVVSRGLPTRRSNP